MAPFRIDGKTLEGGGQVLRIAVACAVTQGKAVTVYSIRGKRPKPGLAAQHLNGLKMVADVCGGSLTGAELHSNEMTLVPRQIKPGSYYADTQTAGSVMLLLQSVLPCVLYARGPTELTLKGGTDADMAPPVDYTTHVFAPVANKFGLKFTLNIQKRGFFPRGGGCVTVKIDELTSPLKAVNLVERGKVCRVGGVCYVSGLPAHMAKTAVSTAKTTLMLEAGLSSSVQFNVSTEVVPDRLFTGNGFGMLLYCETDTGVILGSTSAGAFGRNKPRVQAEEIGDTAARNLAQQLQTGTCVDKDMQNQIILLMGLAEGRSTVLCGEITLHTQTAMEIMQQMTSAKFSVETVGDLHRIVCDGIGLDPNNLPCTT